MKAGTPNARCDRCGGTIRLSELQLGLLHSQRAAADHALCGGTLHPIEASTGTKMEKVVRLVAYEVCAANGRGSPGHPKLIKEIRRAFQVAEDSPLFRATVRSFNEDGQ